MPGSSPKTVTRLLVEWRNGDQEALDRLFPLVYDELHDIAGRYMRGERSDNTLQATALVHEAYLRLIRLKQITWQDRAHFFAVAARMMRRVLHHGLSADFPVCRFSCRFSLNPDIQIR